MKFTSSPIVELPVRDCVLSIQQDNHSMHVGTSVWPCSLLLVKFAERWSTTTSSPPPDQDHPTTTNPYAALLDFPTKRAVEIGSGTGAASMGLHLLGLHDLVVTDIAPVMPALKHNLRRNKPLLKKTLKTAQLYWNKPDQIAALSPPFDLVIATDVVYVEETVGALVGAMEALVGDKGAVLLGYQIRSVEADGLFWEMCGRVFDVELVPREHLHPEYAYEEANVYILRKKLL